jgi:hypothetical protein
MNIYGLNICVCELVFSKIGVGILNSLYRNEHLGGRVNIYVQVCTSCEVKSKYVNVHIRDFM